jgi:hypothetical protein
MTANKFSSAGGGAGPAAQKLKQALVDFATSGDLGLEFARQKQSTLKFKGALDDVEEMLILDWFIFDWMDEGGSGVIDRFLASHESLDNEQQKMIVEWGSSIHNIFEIIESEDDRLILKELDDGTTLIVRPGTPAGSEPSVEPGRFLMARLLPVHGSFHFSGPQLVLPDREAALQALEMAQSLGVVTSPAEIEEAQADQRKGFIEFFGGPEVTIKSSELDETLQRFEKHLLSDRREATAGATGPASLRAKFGVEAKTPSMRRAMRLPDQHEVTLLCDEFEGIVVLPRYRDFQRTFECENAEQEISDWEDLVWSYIKDPDIPIVAFEYIAEKQPAKLERLLRVLLDDETFSLEHLYAMLLHYKEPVEGLDDLKDDEKLWDLLDRKEPSRHARGSASRETRRPRRAAKATPSATATGAAKKPALKKGRSQPKHKTKKKSAAVATKKSGASKKATKSRKAPLSSKMSVKRQATPKRTRPRKPAKKRPGRG